MSKHNNNNNNKKVRPRQDGKDPGMEPTGGVPHPPGKVILDSGVIALNASAIIAATEQEILKLREKIKTTSAEAAQANRQAEIYSAALKALEASLEHWRSVGLKQRVRPITPETIADKIEAILVDVGEAHVQQLLRLLRERFNQTTSEKNLINTLNRWVSHGRRFKRVRANTFALRDSIQPEQSMTTEPEPDPSVESEAQPA